MCLFEELKALTDCISKIGGNKHLFQEIYNLVTLNDNREHLYEQILNSDSLSHLLRYSDEDQDVLFQQYGCHIGRMLIALTRTLSESLCTRFLIKIASFLDKTHVLYRRCRIEFVLKSRNFLNKDEFQAFFNFLEEVVGEMYSLLKGCEKACKPKGSEKVCKPEGSEKVCKPEGFGKDDIPEGFKIDFNWPNTTSLSYYISYLEVIPSLRNDSWLRKHYDDMVEVTVKILNYPVVKDESMLDLLRVLTRWGKLIDQEIRIREMVCENEEEMMNLAVVVMGINDSKFLWIKSWLHNLGLIPNLFHFLLNNLDSVYEKLSGGKVSELVLASYCRLLSTTRSIAKEIGTGETDLANFFMEREEKEISISKILHIYEKKHCPDEFLGSLEDILGMTDPDLTKAFCLYLIPRIVVAEDEHIISFAIKIKRKQILKSSKRIVLRATSGQLRGPLFVKFRGEPGVGRGVTREWLFLVVRDMFDPQKNYFKGESVDRNRIFPTSGVDKLEVYTFFGRVLALTLIHGVQLGAILDPLLVRMLAELDISIDHIQDFDPALYNGIIDFVPPELFQSTVNDYVLQVSAAKVAKIKEGIDFIFGQQKRQIFFKYMESNHLDMIVGGHVEELCVDKWKQHTGYYGYEGVDISVDISICSFWKIVAEFSEDQKRDLLFFWTAVRYLPPGGFANLASPLRIGKANADAYPNASTCINTLRIPPVSYEELKIRLHVALQQPTGYGNT